MQALYLVLLAMPIACVSWTVTHEEVFWKPKEYCVKRNLNGKTLLERKFFYPFTCEYCFSHCITIIVLFLTGYKLVMKDWRGYITGGFSLVWISNIYISLFGFIRQELSMCKMEVKEIGDKMKNDASSGIVMPKAKV